MSIFGYPTCLPAPSHMDLGYTTPLSCVRKGFHAGCVPIHLVGIGGPGAPHEFVFCRRSDQDLHGHMIEENACKDFSTMLAHPQDVILRSFGGMNEKHDQPFFSAFSLS